MPRLGTALVDALPDSEPTLAGAYMVVKIVVVVVLSFPISETTPLVAVLSEG